MENNPDKAFISLNEPSFVLDATRLDQIIKDRFIPQGSKSSIYKRFEARHINLLLEKNLVHASMTITNPYYYPNYNQKIALRCDNFDEIGAKHQSLLNHIEGGPWSRIENSGNAVPNLSQVKNSNKYSYQNPMIANNIAYFYCQNTMTWVMDIITLQNSITGLITNAWSPHWPCPLAFYAIQGGPLVQQYTEDFLQKNPHVDMDDPNIPWAIKEDKLLNLTLTPFIAASDKDGHVQPTQVTRQYQIAKALQAILMCPCLSKKQIDEILYQLENILSTLNSWVLWDLTSSFYDAKKIEDIDIIGLKFEKILQRCVIVTQNLIILLSSRRKKRILLHISTGQQALRELKLKKQMDEQGTSLIWQDKNAIQFSTTVEGEHRIPGWDHALFDSKNNKTTFNMILRKQGNTWTLDPNVQDKLKKHLDGNVFLLLMHQVKDKSHQMSKMNGGNRNGSRSRSLRSNNSPRKYNSIERKNKTLFNQNFQFGNGKGKGRKN